MSAHRYALYFAPAEDHPLSAAGRAWLQAGRPHTAEPRRYGFHATLKPPFRLREGVREVDFYDAVQAFAREVRPFEMPALHVAMLSDFLALRPRGLLAKDHPLCRFADACVERFEPLRAPLLPDELAKRRAGVLSPIQRQRLERYGYPYVFEEWRFHMTLSDPLRTLDVGEIEAIVHNARAHFGPALMAPMLCEHLCVFVEPAPGQAFFLARREPLAL